MVAGSAMEAPVTTLTPCSANSCWARDPIPPAMTKVDSLVGQPGRQESGFVLRSEDGRQAQHLLGRGVDIDECELLAVAEMGAEEPIARGDGETDDGIDICEQRTFGSGRLGIGFCRSRRLRGRLVLESENGTQSPGELLGGRALRVVVDVGSAGIACLDDHGVEGNAGQQGNAGLVRHRLRRRPC